MQLGPFGDGLVLKNCVASMLAFGLAKAGDPVPDLLNLAEHQTLTIS